jgi:hypothetical protein
VGQSDEDLNYAYNATISELIRLAIDCLKDAGFSSGDLEMGVNLKMASRTLQLAMEIFRDRHVLRGGKEVDEYVQDDTATQ